MSLNGKETLQVLGQDATGQPAATTEQTTTGAIAALAGANPNVAIAVGAAATASVGKTYLLNAAAGSVLTLPPATGSGGVIKAFVTTTATSGAHKILAATAADFLDGNVVGQHSNTPLQFSATPATDNSLQMPFAGTQPSGGFIGDWFELQDVALHTWMVKGMFQAGTTPTTPFSTADT